jgi:hypothetical protein
MRKSSFTLLLFLALVTSCALFPREVAPVAAFVPEIITVDQGAIQNAGAGTEIWNGGPGNGVTNLVRYAVRVSEYSVNSMIRPGWDAFESQEGVYHFEKMDKLFEYGIQYGQKINLACFVTSCAGTQQKIDGAFCCYPAYVHEAMQKSEQKDRLNTLWLNKVTHWEPNFENDYFFGRYDALLKAFAAYLEKPITFGGKTVPRKKLVRCIELRHFGYWGEGAYHKNLIPSNSSCLIRFADAYVRHFPDIRLVVPTNGMGYNPSTHGALVDYHFHLLTMSNRVGLAGIFRDNWGCDESEAFYQRLFNAANLYEIDGVKLYELLRGRWKSAPLVGEPGKWGPKKEGFRPYWGLYEQVSYLRPAMIRNCNVSEGRHTTNPTDYSIHSDPRALDAFHRAYAVIGFRYLFTEARIKRGNGHLEIGVDWLNIGFTPTYDAWRIRYFMEDDSGKEIWTGDSTLDLRTVLPDESTPPGVVRAEKVRTHVDRFDEVPTAGRLFIQIVNPDGISPNMALSIKGRTASGAYPLGETGF